MLCRPLVWQEGLAKTASDMQGDWEQHSRQQGAKAMCDAQSICAGEHAAQC